MSATPQNPKQEFHSAAELLAEWRKPEFASLEIRVADLAYFDGVKNSAQGTAWLRSLVQSGDVVTRQGRNRRTGATFLLYSLRADTSAPVKK